MKTSRNTTGSHSQAAAQLRRTRLLPVVSPQLLLFLGFEILLLLLQNLDVLTASEAILAISAASVTQGLWAFWRHGGKHFSAAGSVCFSFALFVGFAGLYSVAIKTSTADLPLLLVAASYSFALQVCLYYGWWESSSRHAPDASAFTIPSRTARWGSQVGLAMIGVAILAGQTIADSVVLDQAAFSGAVLLMLSQFCRTNSSQPAVSALVTLLLTGVLGAVVFTGFGRLQLGALGLAAAASAAYGFRGKVVKLVLILTTAPVLIYLAQRRVAFTAGLNPDQENNVTGFESVISPLVRFGDLLNLSDSGLLDAQNFSSFFATLTVFVPRSLWPDKPIGFGAELADFFYPGLSGSGFSVVALSQGEWVWAFGILGPIIMLPLLGVTVRGIDRTLAQLRDVHNSSPDGLIKLAILTVLVSGMPDLIWGGTFTFITRSGLRILILVLVLAIYKLIILPRKDQPQA